MSKSQFVPALDPKDRRLISLLVDRVGVLRICLDQFESIYHAIERKRAANDARHPGDSSWQFQGEGEKIELHVRKASDESWDKLLRVVQIMCPSKPERQKRRPFMPGRLKRSTMYRGCSA